MLPYQVLPWPTVPSEVTVPSELLSFIALFPINSDPL